MCRVLQGDPTFVLKMRVSGFGPRGSDLGKIPLFTGPPFKGAPYSPLDVLTPDGCTRDRLGWEFVASAKPLEWLICPNSNS